jgi:PAS domain S-box-containing protein
LKRNRFLICGTLVFAFFLTVFSGCEKPSKEQPDGAIETISFRDIPGVTQSEISAIEALRKKYGSFDCAVNPSADSFYDKNGEPVGFAILFYEWLSGIFGIPFKPVFCEWNDLLSGIADGGIGFTIELTETPERRADYFMTSPIAQRPLKIYRIEGSEPIANIVNSRPPRYAFLAGSALAADIAQKAGYDFETIFVSSHAEAYPLLESGEIDAYIALDNTEAVFDAYGNVAGEDFSPLIFKSFCLLTGNTEFEPVISVLEKALDIQTLSYLAGLRRAGYQKYLGSKLYALLTEEERSYIKDHPIVPVAAEFNNYPISFFDTHANQWQGIYFDALNEIASLTGIKFELVSSHNAALSELIAMLENGEALIISELYRIKENEDRFLWSEVPLLNDNYAFITRSDFHNIDIGEVSYLRVGFRKNSHYCELFKEMFPGYRFTEYDNQEEAWNALKRGELDAVFSSRRRLVIYTNYNEEAGFKLNLIFDHVFDSSFGYNKDAAVLVSIVDKALNLIKIKNISNQWMNKSYDYRFKLAEAQRPLLIGASVLIFLVLFLVSILLIKSRNASRQLEKLVKKRTGDFAFEASKLQAMIDSIPDILFCKDMDFKYTQCNNYFEQFMGVNEADILGKANVDGKWFPPEEVEKIHEIEQTVIDKNRISIFEEKIRSPFTGKEGIYETVKAPIRQDGAVVGIIAIIRDIGQRKEMERELALQTSMLRTMISSLPDAIFCKDLDFKYTLCNKYMADVYDKEVGDIIGMDDESGLGLSGEAAIFSNDTDKRVVSEQRRIVYEEWIRSNGIKRLFETVKSPLILDGEIIGVMGIGRDITQRKDMEEDLAFKTSKLQMVIDSIPDILFCKDSNFRYTQCNRQFEEFWGVREATMIDLTDEDGTWFSIDTIKRMRSTEATVMGEDTTLTREVNFSAPFTGREGIFEMVLSPLKQGGAVVGMMGIARDVTQRKIMEEAVEAASRAKSAFFANMSHELRTPLNVVIGLTDLILEDDSLDRNVMGNLIKISSAGNMLLSIVNDILDFSKIESGKLELKPIEYSTPSLLNDVITIVITRLGEKPIKFSLDIDDDLPAKLCGDDLRVKQIFTNLLTNAVKYTREGSVELSVHCAREGDTVWMDLAVSDTGIGIREEDIKKLFSDYNQVDTKANRNIEGTGLGLAITKKLAEMMNGQIRVESEYGRGSTFRLRLRQGFVSDTPVGTDIADKLRNFCYADDKRIVTKKLVRLNLSYAKVLVVDDMQTNLDVAAGLLRKYNMQVDCLDSGPAAIKRINEGTPVYNAIFMDHMMPGMDGIETTESIRALGTEYAHNIPIIALTANAIQGTEQMFYEHGFQAFISKPIDVMEMDTVIREWVYDDTHEETLVSSEQVSEMTETGAFSIEIAGVNTKKGLSLYAGDTGIYLPLLRSYAANTPGVLDKLRTVSAQNLHDYVITVHGLKGTSAGIGAEAIREAALELETKSRAGDLQVVLAQNGKLITDTEVIVGNIKAWLQQYDAAHDAKPRLKAPDRELLSRLRQSCQSYDIENIDKAMSELESADYEEGADLVAWIREKIDISKMGEVARRLAEEGIG